MDHSGEQSGSAQSASSKRAREAFAREEARHLWMSRLTTFALILVALGICAVIAANNLPEYREWRRLENEYAEVLKLETQVLEEREERQSTRKALQSDEEYLQLIARDKLDRALPGETIIRIERD